MKKILSVILSLMLVFAGMAPAAFAAEAASNDATLVDISFDNHSVVNGVFDPSVTSYTVQQPYRFSKDGNYYKDAPVTVIKSDANATVGEITRVNNENNTQTITIPVTAEDGVTKKTYTLTVTKVGRNQYSNSGFENEELGSSWAMSAASTDSMEKSNDFAYSGSSSLKYIGKASTSYPYQSVALTKDSNMTFFSHLAVKSESLSMRAYNRYTSADSHYYVDADGDVITEGDGDALTCNPTSFLNGVLTEADENGWRRSMRISKGLSMLQESATSGDANGKASAYFDEFYVGPLVIGSVNVTSDGEGYVKCGEAKTINFEAELLNQYGNKGGLTNETVAWHLINAPEGVTIDEDTGEVTVPETLSKAGEFYVEARVVPTFNKGITSSWSIHCQSWMGGRAKVSVIPYNASAQLSDIEVNGGGLVEAFSEDNNATIYVPYVYKANDFNNYAMPEVIATPVDADGNVKITYPQTVADGEKIYIDVTDASGVLSTRYTLTIKTVGGNLFPDGGFETELSANYKNVDFGSLTLSAENSEIAGAGQKMMSVMSKYDSSGNVPMLGYGDGITLSSNKTYVNGLMVRINPERPEGNTCISFTPAVKSYKDYDAPLKRKTYTTDNYYSLAGDSAGKLLSLKDTSWMTVMTVFASETTQDVRVGIGMPAANGYAETYLLMDELYLGELVVADMAVKDAEGNTSKTVTQPDANTTINLTAAIENQYGNKVGLENETAAWAVLDNYTGVSVAADGTVTVSEDAAAGTAIIEATVTPSYKGAAQPAVKKRYKLTILSKDGFIADGGTYTVNYTNKTDKDMTLRFISAIYEGGVLDTVQITDNIPVAAGATISKSHTMTKGENQSIRNFLWDKVTLVPIITE